jgi:hypothetical protein
MVQSIGLGWSNGERAVAMGSSVEGKIVSSSLMHLFYEPIPPACNGTVRRLPLLLTLERDAISSRGA